MSCAPDLTPQMICTQRWTDETSCSEFLPTYGTHFSHSSSADLQCSIKKRWSPACVPTIDVRGIHPYPTLAGRRDAVRAFDVVLSDAARQFRLSSCSASAASRF